MELPVVSPFSFAIYASVIKENMMLEDPTAAIERIYREMYAKVESVMAAPPVHELQNESRARVRRKRKKGAENAKGVDLAIPLLPHMSEASP